MTEDAPQRGYAEAAQLLAQLRVVALALPGSLDSQGIGEDLLRRIEGLVPLRRGALLVGSVGTTLTVAAQTGDSDQDWPLDWSQAPELSEIWADQAPRLSSTIGELAEPVVALPLVSNRRTIGLILLEPATKSPRPSRLVAAQRELAPMALRLEAALLFDQVRRMATTEERQRLAREIHDGVAQELVMIGYGLDNAMAALPDVASTAEELGTLRDEVTRLITELRLNLFELRSGVGRHRDLASALAEYARTVAGAGGIRVHLGLGSSGGRLPATTEAELLRIAQEAVTNARKHSGAANLWLTCEVEPPYAYLAVEDDGRGTGYESADGHYGMTIMAERAARIRGTFEVRRRQPSGTSVRVTVGSRPAQPDHPPTHNA